MLRRLCTIVALCGAATGADAQAGKPQPPRPLETAISAATGGRWEVAHKIAQRDGPAAVAIVDYMRLYAGQGDADEVLGFVQTHPVWPGLARFRQRNEKLIATATTDQILAFYKGYTAQTGLGALSHAAALKANGQTGEAEASLVLAWRTLDLTTEEHDLFIEVAGKMLKPHHPARLEMALWRGLKDVAQMLPLVDAKTRARAEAWQTIENGGSLALADLPAGGDKDPGIAHARFNEHIRKDEVQSAIDLILTQSASDEGLGEPARWAGWRRILARGQMREGQPDLAYRLASTHGLTEGASFADLEWLSGYLALTYLESPELALDHFQRFRSAVASPISLGRAGYWLGRAQDAMDDAEAAQISYAFGAQYQTSFYGLLAAERAGVKLDPALKGISPDDDWRAAEFADSTLFKAAVLLQATGRLSQSEQYFVALANSLEKPDLALLGQALAEMDQPHLQVMIAKSAAKRGIVLPGPYYALHPMTEMDLPVEMELALAIARRESEFDKNVTSGVGAQGLMQLMPGTASDVARDLGLTHDRGRVLSDWSYNARLGSAYLAQLIERFDGNVIMVAAGYNAGPGRPIRWMETYGDPRKSGEGIIDWIEHIPFRETRNYVMRVAESLPVYRARLGKDPLPVPFSQELSGNSLKVTASN